MANHAAYLARPGGPLIVAPAPYPQLHPGHVTIHNRALALNAMDWKMRSYGMFVHRHPYVLGGDIAGVIVDVGPGVIGFKVDQRVIACTSGLATGDCEKGGFQQYTSVPATMVTPIPDTMSFEDAVTLPISVATAATGLYGDKALNMPFPGQMSFFCGGTVLVWGGSSSVGSAAIQLAKASGYDVVATCSPRNFAYVQSLGASVVVDYNHLDVMDLLLEVLQDKICVGAFDAIGADLSMATCAEVLGRLGGGHFTSVHVPPRCLPQGVTASYIFGMSIVSSPMASALFNGFLKWALAGGIITPSPPPLVIGHGLEAIGQGLDRLADGVSAVKLVVAL